jgi:hypothetical protein
VDNQGIYIGCISANDSETFEFGKTLADYRYAFEGFFVREPMIWLRCFRNICQETMPILFLF